MVPSTIDEVFDFTITASEAAEKLAREKAMEVAQRVHFDLIIAADTIVVLEGELLAKPSNKIEAIEMLQKLSANTHEVITGVTLLTPSTERTFSVSTKVTFEELTDSEIEAYVGTGSPMDKAGGYGIQDDLGSLFVKHINGDYYNVVGLPLQRVYSELKSVSPDITNMILSPKRLQPVS